MNCQLQRFRHDEAGTITVLAMIIFVGIIAICGFGVDLMMNEMKRAKLQATLDRAVLAAADLEQNLDPASVVQDYFTKSGMGETLSSTTVDDGLNYRIVSATAQQTSDPLFLGVLGINQMVAPAAGEAMERMSNVEISLVLDRSGSMGSNNKIQNLRAAAREFVDTVIQPAGAPSLTTVNLVSYNATVNLGSVVSQYFNLSAEHNYSSCAIFPDTAFDTLAISRTAELDRLSHFDPWSTSESSTEISSPWCPDDDYGAIVVQSADAEALKDRIDNLGAGGNTAIDLGMKWGTALLDPSSQSLVSDMIADGHADPIVAGRPSAYTDPDALKIIVLMTDGANTTEYDLKPQYQTGLSEVFIDDRGDTDPSNDRFSTRIVDLPGTLTDVYYWDRYENSSFSYKYRSTPDGGTNARQMTNAETFARWGTRGRATKLFRTPYQDGQLPYATYANQYNAYEGIVGADHADTRLAAICDQAKSAGVVVFAIGFEAPQRGLDAMENCASSPAHYFDVAGVEISDAFNSIARTITQLRLTQ
ncbi:pilus assembly protein TadG-related protein [Marinovum sp.]|uniref:pilus assembly protein TadG-related protein n=1 Tax=Marinovum sp. TaxID=2024839 RepID=UPI003A9362FE